MTSKVMRQTVDLAAFPDLIVIYLGMQGFLRSSGGTGFWHETYFMRGGMEAVYDDVQCRLGWDGSHRCKPHADRCSRREPARRLPARRLPPRWRRPSSTAGRRAAERARRCVTPHESVVKRGRVARQRMVLDARASISTHIRATNSDQRVNVAHRKQQQHPAYFTIGFTTSRF